MIIWNKFFESFYKSVPTFEIEIVAAKYKILTHLVRKMFWELDTCC